MNVGDILGSQVTDSENHHWPIRELSDEGGEFFTQKKYVDGEMFNVSASAYDDVNKRTIKYNGPIVPLSPPWTNYFPPAMNSSDAELIKIGTDAIARSKPTNSVANLAVALAELLREGVPRAAIQSWEKRIDSRRRARNDKSFGADASDDFLNIQFGWKPLLGEISDVATGVLKSDALLRQYERDAGRVVRRRWSFPETKTVEWEHTPTNNSRPYYSPGHFRLNSPTVEGGLYKTRTFSQRRWFSAAYSYHLPPYWEELGDVAQKAKHLLGVELTPEVIWNLVPWSWTIDWFSSLGSVISNLEDMADQSLVMRYGYLMEHTIVKDTYTRVYNTPPLNGMVPPVFSHSITFVTETKLRKKANPYGFGVSWDSLSNLQKAILAAIGITRSSR
jgi:hypothetical protein